MEDKRHILLVEDSPTQAAKLRYLLEGEGYRISVAGNAETAMEILSERPFALVISDVLMPGLSGFELCRHINSDNQLKGTAVILVTALKTPEDVVNGLISGADAFLTKPYSEDFLLDMVKTVLTKRESLHLRSEDDGVDIVYGGKKYTITAQRHHIVNLLLSTFENVVQKNQELEQANRELTTIQQKLQENEDRLQQQTVDLARANAELESFSYSVSHDLRQPLRVIKNFAQLLGTDLQKSRYVEAQQRLGHIEGSVEKMDSIINELLNLSRVTRHAIAKEHTDLSTIATEIVDELRAEEPERRITVAIQPDMHQQADATLMYQVLNNLLGNAWKYTGKTDSGQVRFKRAEEGRRYVYSITDNGAGFDSRYVDRLFQPFSRLHNESEFKGTGIGLAIVKSIIDRHGGSVWAEGTPGEGSSFFFSLPR